MKTRQDIVNRFGVAAADAIATRLCANITLDRGPRPVQPDRFDGAVTGFAVGAALGRPVEQRSRQWIVDNHGVIEGHVASPARVGLDASAAMLTAEAVLADPGGHPARLAELVAANDEFLGDATGRARARLRRGAPWWEARSANSAGTAAAARCAVFGLLWPHDPPRAAYEAALSASVTHGHPVAIAGAAAFAAALALATRPDDPLDATWLAEAARCCESFPQGDIADATVAGRLRVAMELVHLPPELVLTQLRTGPLALEAVPAALWCAATADLPEDGVLRAVNAGGDTDTIAAMAGACLGAHHGPGAWPGRFTHDIEGLDVMRALARRPLGRPSPMRPEQPPATSSRTNGDEADANPVHVSFLLDRSGSMHHLVDDVVGGFNDFVANQQVANQQKEGACAFTLVQFDSQNPFEVIHDATPIVSVPPLRPDQYRPRGGTPLLDAFGDVITAADRRLARLGRPEDQVVVVFTDGLENASSRWSHDRLTRAIEERKARGGWVFAYLGANQDSFLVAGPLGVDRGSIRNFTADSAGVRDAMARLDKNVNRFRKAKRTERMARASNFWRDDEPGDAT